MTGSFGRHWVTPRLGGIPSIPPPHCRQFSGGRRHPRVIPNLGTGRRMIYISGPVRWCRDIRSQMRKQFTDTFIMVRVSRYTPYWLWSLYFTKCVTREEGEPVVNQSQIIYRHYDHNRRLHVRTRDRKKIRRKWTVTLQSWFLYRYLHYFNTNGVSLFYHPWNTVFTRLNVTTLHPFSDHRPDNTDPRVHLTPLNILWRCTCFNF